jgi:hypothetical protein
MKNRIANPFASTSAIAVAVAAHLLLYLPCIYVTKIEASTPEESKDGIYQVNLQSGVSFRTTDADLQQLFDAAETKAAENTAQFTPEMEILVEGGGYPCQSQDR